MIVASKDIEYDIIVLSTGLRVRCKNRKEIVKTIGRDYSRVNACIEKKCTLWWAKMNSEIAIVEVPREELKDSNFRLDVKNIDCYVTDKTKLLPNQILAFDENGARFVFDTVMTAHKMLGISAANIYRALNNGNAIDGYVFDYTLD